ncbi:hypothetical protein MTO96_029868 [Rhipicephalus appendiculatus]
MYAQAMEDAVGLGDKVAPKDDKACAHEGTENISVEKYMVVDVQMEEEQSEDSQDGMKEITNHSMVMRRPGRARTDETKESRHGKGKVAQVIVEGGRREYGRRRLAGERLRWRLGGSGWQCVW